MRRLAVGVGMAILAAGGGCATRETPAARPVSPRAPVPAPFPRPQDPAPPASTLPATSRLRVRYADGGVTRVHTVDLEAYVAATAISEFAPAAGDEAVVERMLEVQTIIARTYAVRHLGRHGAEGFDLCGTTHCQLYEPGRLETSRWAAAARLAARRTAGQVVVYDGAPIDALYHADCGGSISAASDVWGGPAVPYLPAHADGDAAGDAHRTWIYRTTLETLLPALRDAGLLNATTRRLATIEALDRDVSGRVRTLRINGRDGATIRGTALRDVCARAFGAQSVRSTRFSVAVAGGAVTFTGTGFGHGVGLCQAGAFARLAAGASVTDVLRVYYPGASVAVPRPDTSSAPPPRP